MIQIFTQTSSSLPTIPAVYYKFSHHSLDNLFGQNAENILQLPVKMSVW